MKGKKGAHLFWIGTWHIRIILETTVTNHALSQTTAFLFFLMVLYDFFPFSECLPTCCHDGEGTDFKYEQLQDSANKTSFLKLLKPWPPSSFLDLVGGHQNQTTYVLCQRLVLCALFCWSTMNCSDFLLLCSFQTASKNRFQKHRQHLHCPTVFFSSFKHSSRDGNQEVHKGKLWYRNKHVPMHVYMYCLCKCTHSYLLLSVYLNNNWHFKICNWFTGISHNSSVILFRWQVVQPAY